MLALSLIIIGVISRFIFHIPNFSPIIAIALFSGVYLNKKYAIIVPLALMIITDIFLGFYSAILFTWASIALIAYLGVNLKKNKSFKTVAVNSLFSASLFFFITNFGVWLVSGMYTLDLSGLSRCFYLAIPFFRYTLLSTVIYTFVLFTAYELISARLALSKAAKR